MKRALLLLLTALLLYACGEGSKRNKQAETSPHFIQSFINVALNSTSTWQQVLDVSYLFVDSLSIMAVDDRNINNRLAAQEWGYTAIYVLTDLYEQKAKDGQDVKFADIEPIIKRINLALCSWISTDIDGDLYVWRDHYYACHNEAEEPTSGFFNFIIEIPEYNSHSKTMRITFPMATHKDYPPMLAFKYLSSDGYSEADEFAATVMLEDEFSIRDDIDVMIADVDGDIVDMMLKYDFMYVMFRSMESDNGDPEEFEITRVDLIPFKEKWNSVITAPNE